MKTETIQTPHCVSVLPGVSKNPTHSRHRSHRVFLPLPAFGQQITITFLYFPKQRRKPVPSPKQPTAGRLTTPYGQSSASRRRAVPVPLPAQHLPSALGPRTPRRGPDSPAAPTAAPPRRGPATWPPCPPRSVRDRVSSAGAPRVEMEAARRGGNK